MVVGKHISDRRAQMTPPMTRKQLANKCSMGEPLLATYENGTAKPEQKYLMSLERNLGIKLRGKDIGSDLFPKKS